LPPSSGRDSRLTAGLADERDSSATGLDVGSPHSWRFCSCFVRKAHQVLGGLQAQRHGADVLGLRRLAVQLVGDFHDLVGDLEPEGVNADLCPRHCGPPFRLRRAGSRASPLSNGRGPSWCSKSSPPQPTSSTSCMIFRCAVLTACSSSMRACFLLHGLLELSVVLGRRDTSAVRGRIR
jgi:hypothetical protein